MPRRPSYSVPALCISTAAGLHPFHAPELPADLGQGYPEAYTQKDEDVSVGVEPVASAVAKVCDALETRLGYVIPSTTHCNAAGRPARSM